MLSVPSFFLYAADPLVPDVIFNFGGSGILASVPRMPLQDFVVKKGSHWPRWRLDIPLAMSPEVTNHTISN
jgi:hypothetical protein